MQSLTHLFVAETGQDENVLDNFRKAAHNVLWSRRVLRNFTTSDENNSYFRNNSFLGSGGSLVRQQLEDDQPPGGRPLNFLLSGRPAWAVECPHSCAMCRQQPQPCWTRTAFEYEHALQNLHALDFGSSGPS